MHPPLAARIDHGPQREAPSPCCQLKMSTLSPRMVVPGTTWRSSSRSEGASSSSPYNPALTVSFPPLCCSLRSLFGDQMNGTCDGTNGTCPDAGFNGTDATGGVKAGWSSDGLLAIAILVASVAGAVGVIYYLWGRDKPSTLNLSTTGCVHIVFAVFSVYPYSSVTGPSHLILLRSNQQPTHTGPLLLRSRSPRSVASTTSFARSWRRRAPNSRRRSAGSS